MAHDASASATRPCGRTPVRVSLLPQAGYETRPRHSAPLLPRHFASAYPRRYWGPRGGACRLPAPCVPPQECRSVVCCAIPLSTSATVDDIDTLTCRGTLC